MAQGAEGYPWLAAVGSFIAGVGGLLVAVLNAMGTRQDLDALKNNVVYRDTCKTCGSGLQRELQVMRSTIERQHGEQMELIKLVHQNLPKKEANDD